MKSPVTGFQKAGRGVKLPCGLPLPRTNWVTFEEARQSFKGKICCPFENKRNPLGEKDLDVVSYKSNIEEDCFKYPIL